MSTLPAVFETPMGRIDADFTVTNLVDHVRAQSGEIAPDAVRSVTVDRALVDTGATLLCLPADMITQLGLHVRQAVPIATAKGPGMARLFQGAEITIRDRSATVDVLELPAGTTPLLGVIPLEALGIELDLRNRQLRLLPLEPGDTYFTVL